MDQINQIKLFRIKAAGKNISTVAVLILISNLIPVIAFFHISNLDFSKINGVGKYYMLYGLVYLILTIAILFNLFNAGDNLRLCDVDIIYEEKETNQIVFRETKDNKTLKIISTNNNTLGAKVFIGDEIAPDGEYSYLKDNRKLIVKDGKIEKMLT